MPSPSKGRRSLRGAIELAVVLALLSLVLPGRGLGLMLLGAVIGFVIGLAIEAVLSRRHRS